MGRSLQFRVYEHQLSALFRLGFPTAPHFLLNLAGARNSLAHSSIGTPSLALRLLVDIRFQVLFHSAPAVLFTFPSRYWSTIAHSTIFSLGGWSRLLPTRFLVSRRTQDPACFLSHVVYGACTLFGRASNRVPLCSIRLWQSFNPVPRDGLGWSPFARRYSGNHSYFLLLRVLRCFSSPRTSHIPMDSEYDDRSSIGRVPPFGYRWIFAP